MRQAIVAAEDTPLLRPRRRGPEAACCGRWWPTHAAAAVAQGASTLTMQYVRNVLKSDPQPHRGAARRPTADHPAARSRRSGTRWRWRRSSPRTRSSSATSTSPTSAPARTASPRPRSATSASTPAQLTLGEAALLAGLVQSPDADNPIDGDPNAALEPPRLRAGLDGRMARSPPREAAEAKAEPLTLHPAARPTTAPRSREHNDWGFFCDYFRQWWDPSRRSAPPPPTASRRCAGAATPSSPRSTPTSQAARSWHRSRSTATDKRAPLPMAAVAARAPAGCWRSRQPALQPGANPKGQANYPNTVNQLDRRRRQRHRVPGGLDVQDVHHARRAGGRPAAEHRLRRAGQLTTSTRPSGPGQLRRLLVPGERQPVVDGRLPHHVERLRPLGQHLLRLAGAAGRRREGGRDGPAARHHVPRRQRRQAWPARRARAGASFTLGVAATTPLDLANAYATVAAEGMYCAPLPVISITDATGQELPAGNPSCQQVLDPDVAARRDRRRPLPGRPAVGLRPCDGGTATAVAGMLGGRPVAGKTGSSEQQRDRDVRRCSPRRSPRRRSPPTRTTRATRGLRGAGPGRQRGRPDAG